MIEDGNDFDLDDVINLVRETQHLERILPMTFYHQAQNSDAHNVLKSASSSKGETSLGLSPEDHQILTYGWTGCLRSQQEHTYKWLFYEGDEHFLSCQSKEACFSARSRAVICRFTPFPQVMGLKMWDDWIEMKDVSIRVEDVGICRKCQVEAERMHNEGRKKFWDMLPSLFDLPGWDELLNKP